MKMSLTRSVALLTLSSCDAKDAKDVSDHMPPLNYSASSHPVTRFVKE